MPAKITMDRTKFASGPATTTAARAGHALMHEADLAFGFGHGGGRGVIGHARGILVAEKFHIAAERNSADLPARIVAVVESEQLGPEADGKGHDFDATPAGHDEMAELVEKHDYG